MKNRNLGVYWKLCLVFVFTLGIYFSVQPQKTFWVYDDDKASVVKISKWQSAKDAIKMAKVKLSDKDNFILSSGNIVQIVRPIELVVFKDGEKKSIFTSELTLEKALAKEGISLTDVKIFPDPNIRPSQGMNVALLKANEKIVQEQREIAYQVVNRPDSHMELGQKTVLNEGVNGSKNVLVKLVELASGQLEKIDLAEYIITPAKEQIVAMGTTNTVETSRGSMRFSRVINMEATAYTPWDEGCIGITKMGIPAKRGVVAVDPDVVPLGSRIYIPSYGHAIAADTGGAIQGNRIDLCVDTKGEAFSFGRRMVKVYVLE